MLFGSLLLIPVPVCGITGRFKFRLTENQVNTVYTNNIIHNTVQSPPIIKPNDQLSQ
jgi:hypothetical protein